MPYDAFGITLPVESEFKNVDPKHGFGAVTQILVLIFFEHRNLVLLIPLLLPLQLGRLTLEPALHEIEMRSWILDYLLDEKIRHEIW